MTAPILIVDDEPAIRRLVRGALTRAEYDSAEAATAAEALALARRPGCVLVLLDPSSVAFPVANTTNHKLKIAASGGNVTGSPA